MSKRTLAVLVLCLTTYSTPFAQTSDQARKFDEFGSICCADLRARLDNFAAHLLEDPTALGYIIFYEGRRYASCDDPRPKIPRRGEGAARAELMVGYLLDTHSDIGGIPIALVTGGYREQWEAELWIVPDRSKPPKATPTLAARDVKYRKGKIPEREYACIRNVRGSTPPNVGMHPTPRHTACHGSELGRGRWAACTSGGMGILTSCPPDSIF